MKQPRVKRGPGPKSRLTKGNYRKKALKFLLTDFEGRCAYCLDPSDFRHPSQSQVDHFDCKLHKRARNQYCNLMLACSACNHTKHNKPVVNPFDRAQRLLNCTEENEFPEHIVETPDGQWQPVSAAAEYHLVSIGLQERSHQAKRASRRQVAAQILSLLNEAVCYRHANPVSLHNQVMQTISTLLVQLDAFPPLITERGVQSVRDWLVSQGVNRSFVNALSAPQPHAS
jgi:hypothetical protein